MTCLHAESGVAWRSDLEGSQVKRGRVFVTREQLMDLLENEWKPGI
jgi:hypothetical protein